jgi:hypothetical protein
VTPSTIFAISDKVARVSVAFEHTQKTTASFFDARKHL